MGHIVTDPRISMSVRAPLLCLCFEKADTVGRARKSSQFVPTFTFRHLTQRKIMFSTKRFHELASKFTRPHVRTSDRRVLLSQRPEQPVRAAGLTFRAKNKSIARATYIYGRDGRTAVHCEREDDTRREWGPRRRRRNNAPEPDFGAAAVLRTLRKRAK